MSLKIWVKKKNHGNNDELLPLHLAENGKETCCVLNEPDRKCSISESMTSDTGKWEPRNLIHRYAFGNNVEGLRKFLKDRAHEEWYSEVNKADSGNDRYCMYPLHYAALGHSADAAKALIEAGADMSEILNKRCFIRPFHMTALYGEWETRTGKKESQDELFDVFYKQGHMRVDKTSAGTGSTPLHYACLRKNFALAKKLIDAGANVNACETDSLVTPLHLACEYNAPEIVKILLDAGANVLFVDSAGNSALHYASRCDSVDIVKLIIDKAGDSQQFLCQKNKRQCTALQLAVEHDRHFIVQYLFARHEKFGSAFGNHNLHLLHIAAKKGFANMVSLLCQHGWNTEERDKDGRTPLHMAALYNQVEVVRKLISLIERKADIEAEDDLGYTPLLGAVSKDNLEVVEVLWKYSLITALTFFGDSVLMVAVKENAVRCLKFLLVKENHTEEVWKKIEQMTELPNLDLDTPLHIVAKTGNLKAFDLLINHYIDINMRNFGQKTPLHVAVEHGHVNLVKRLLDISTCSINLRDKDSNTPLFLAVQKNNVKMINVLLDYGANILIENFFEKIPLDIAIEKGNMNVIEILLDRQPKNDLKRARRNVYPLHYAVENKQVPVIEMLLEKSYYVDISLVNEEGMTCMDLALKNQYEEGVIALLKTPEWQKLVRRRPCHSNENSPIQLMIKYMPDVAAQVFNLCIHDINQEEDVVIHNYEFLDDVFVLPDDVAKNDGTHSPFSWDVDKSGQLKPEARQRCDDFETIIKTHPLNLMVKEKQFDLLSHDLVESYLKQKWNGITKWFYYTACLFYLIFVLFLSNTIISMTPPGSTTENITNYDEVQCLLPDSKPYVLFGFIIILIVLMAFKFRGYFNSTKFILEKLLELAVCIIALPLSAFCHFFSGYVQWTLLVVMNFIAWINLLNYIRKLPRFGVYVLMVWNTIATFLRFSPIFVLFLLPFSVTFHVLLGDSPGLINLLRRILQTIVFLTGEFNYEDNIASSQYILTYVMFFLYLLVGTVFLMNLLVGLAVSDTNDAMEEATKTRIGLEVDMVLHVESCFPPKMRKIMTRGNRRVHKKKRHTALFFLKEMTRWFGLTKSALKRQQTNKEVGANPAFYDLSRQGNNTKDEIHEKLNILTAQLTVIQEQLQNMQNKEK